MVGPMICSSYASMDEQGLSASAKTPTLQDVLSPRAHQPPNVRQPPTLSPSFASTLTTRPGMGASTLPGATASPLPPGLYPPCCCCTSLLQAGTGHLGLGGDSEC